MEVFEVNVVVALKIPVRRIFGSRFRMVAMVGSIIVFPKSSTSASSKITNLNPELKMVLVDAKLRMEPYCTTKKRRPSESSFERGRTWL